MLRCVCGIAQLRGLSELLLDDNRFEEVSEGTLGGVVAAEQLNVLSLQNNPVQHVAVTEGISRIPNLIVDKRFLKSKERRMDNRRSSAGVMSGAENKPPQARKAGSLAPGSRPCPLSPRSARKTP